MAGQGDRMTWDHHADHDLLTAITQELQPSQEQLRQVMARMHGFGYTCTVKAITQHLQKLRRKEGGPAANNGEGAAGAASPAPKTPRKKVTTSAKSTPASSGRKRKAPKKEEDEDDEEQTPSKKVKKEESDSEGDALPPHNYHSTTI
ncbi:hypothetical protein B0H63DRAFT_145684 [Podospora didyma]|uniref:Uncharacterized protein n=1 Tax=Podospora didyma TaxID=330526 RepID=A0AAE0NT62_9PEZI|nr:hypothetical protein B0H63DRAFT_145684 [Podospora didyma]